MIPDAAALAFHKELTARFPPLEFLAENDADDPPWNMSPDATDSVR